MKTTLNDEDVDFVKDLLRSKKSQLYTLKKLLGDDFDRVKIIDYQIKRINALIDKLTPMR